MDLPIKNGGSFHSYVNVYQRVLFADDFRQKTWREFPVLIELVSPKTAKVARDVAFAQCLLVMNLPIEHIIAAILGLDSKVFFTGESRIVKPAWVVVKHGDLLGNVLFTDWFIGAKRREWMGCWGLLGWLLLVIMDHSRKFPAKHQ